MNKLLLPFFLFLGITFHLSSVASPMVWVEFRDKENSPYTLENPGDFLSQRSLERRLKNNIPLDFYDLPVSPAYVETLTTDLEEQLKLYYTSRWFNGALFEVNDELVTDLISDYEFVKSVEVVKPSLSQKPEKNTEQDEDSSSTQSVNNNTPSNGSFKFPRVHYTAMDEDNFYYQNDEVMEFIELVNGQYLHDKGYNGQGTIITVLDSGFKDVDKMEGFRYLWDTGKIMGYHDFVNPRGSIFDTHTHGTSVLSVMAGMLNQDYRGGAPDAYYYLVRTEDASTEFRIEEYNWLAGAEYADSVGADIINSSLGYSEFDDSAQNYIYNDLNGETTVAARAANMAFDRGILVVNSAGNYGNNNWQYIGTPADALGTLAIGGTDNQGERVSFSSIGPTADGRIKPDVMAQGRSVPVISISDQVMNANGTSFASPLMAAMAACLLQKHPEATNEQLRNAITRSADKYFNPDNFYGYGIPDFEAASLILQQEQKNQNIVSLSVNPISQKSSLKFFLEHEDKVMVELFNSKGHLVLRTNQLDANPGYNEIKPFTDVNSLASGIYFIRIGFSDRNELIKAIKL
ncbi:MAG: S8 family serine peptidase [Bacteroidota bacterium]